MGTLISWAEETWNPVTGCTKVSTGCKHCYAERITRRAGRDFAEVTLHPDRLPRPVSWKRPKLIFVCSMADLFHAEVPDHYVGRVMSVMRMTAGRHRYIVLTKRPARMADYAHAHGWPSNAWAGTSVENQAVAGERLAALLRVPARVRMVSAEPLLGPLDLREWLPHLQWVIAGGESGRDARPMRADWARELRDQSAAAGVAFHFKQWGEHDARGNRVGVKQAGRVLDGELWDEFPQPLESAAAAVTATEQGGLL